MTATDVLWGENVLKLTVVILNTLKITDLSTVSGGTAWYVISQEGIFKRTGNKINANF